MLETKPKPVILIGRSLKDYRRCGTAVPAGFAQVECRLCGTLVVLSHDGAAKLREPGWTLVMCNPCGMEAMTKLKSIVVTTTPHGAANLEKSDTAKATLAKALAIEDAKRSGE